MYGPLANKFLVSHCQAEDNESQTSQNSSHDGSLRDLLLNELDLECPCCLDIPRGVVLQCMKGHMICTECRKKLTKCPSCREAYKRLMPRSLIAERLIIMANLNEENSQMPTEE